MSRQPELAAALASKLEAFRSEALAIFGRIESSPARAITLDESYDKLAGLNLRQDDLFRQALRCVENGLYRAAHVMAWAGFVDCLQSLSASDGFTKLRAARPKWSISTVEELAENYTEHALIEALEAAGVIGKAERKAFHGMLSKRNECAHPTPYFPNANETLGYISELFSRLRTIESRHPKLALPP